MDLRRKDGGEGLVGGQQVLQSLRLQTEGQSQKQETHPNDKFEVIESQVLQTEEWACVQENLPETIRTPRGR